MDMKDRQGMLDRQREFVKNNPCPHLIQCATTDQLVQTAIELMRRGRNADAALGAAMLGGPCITEQ